MKNLPFVLWLLGYGAIVTVQHRVPVYWDSSKPSDGAVVVVFLLELATWIFVACLLYER